MAERASTRAERARAASRDELRVLLHDKSHEVLAALLENPVLDEALLCLLLERKDLPGDFLGEVARRKEWMRSYRVKVRVAGHPHSSRLVALPLLRQLFLFDLVNLTLQPATPAEIRRVAEDVIVNRLPQLALGQRLTLARRGSARVAAALLAEGHQRVVPLALDNAFLTESQVLKVLAREDLPTIVPASVARHRKWSCLYNVRMALVRHPLTPLARVLAFLPDLTLRDLDELSGARSLSRNLKNYILAEVALRRRAGPQAARRRGA
ncbi:MAG: hypothetical protein HY234_16055 [Acidobacteria bacterium]|nr:hypothetical protein [Acidobacteriota bacterium]MBI3664550.1 hypothetical protein [Acidobacteriota bacterium]